MPANTLEQQNVAQQSRAGNQILPRVDIYENEQEVLLVADLPGVAPGNIDLRYERGELALYGKRDVRPHTGQEILEEAQECDFYRVFQLHESIDAAKIDADYKEGVLTVHLPKDEAIKPKLVTVKTA